MTIFKFDEKGRKFSKWVENTMGKEKLLVMSNFSISLSVFKRLKLQTCENNGLFGKMLKVGPLQGYSCFTNTACFT